MPGGRPARRLIRPAPAAAPGFTLIELLVVMAIVAILSAMAVARYGDRDVVDEIGYSQELASAARYAQKLAVASRCPVRLTLSDASQYALTRPDSFAAGTCAANFNAAVSHPATRQPPYSGSAPFGVSVTAAGGFPVVRTFDAQGGVSPATDATIQVGTRTVTIVGSSGRVTVQ